MRSKQTLGLFALLLAMGTAGCDDQVKRVPWFKTMFRQASVETYEAPAILPAEGAVPLGAVMHYDLATADTLLTNPVAAGPEALERGRILYTQFCIMCHGTGGAGDGPVVGVNRLPVGFITMNLTRPDALALSDGYIFGMIANGRGLMPSYRRVPADERWYVVHYVRSLQGMSTGSAAPAAAD
ncbi:MAG: cytochrome c [Gemmatimonadales bacterium]|nr:MAG: cytochrome c [Gemmatimonadales bacterium]